MGDGEGALWVKTCEMALFPLSAPLFAFKDDATLPQHDTGDFLPQPGTFYALSAPAPKHDPRAVPVRGDLAHIRLAGQVFVPHYVVPVPYRTVAQASLLAAPAGEELAVLEAATEFHVLDITSDYVWGEVPQGLVGYIARNLVESI
jgi:hypothetical protein